MKSIKEFLLASWIILIPFQDSGLQGLPIAFLGGSPSFIPGALLILLVFTEWLVGRTGYRFNRSLIYIIGYIVVVNALYLILFGTESHGTNLIVKSFNLTVLTGLLILPIFFFPYDSPRLGKYIKTAFIISLAGVLLGDLLKLDFFVNSPFLHFNENLSMRPRGFALESSTLSAQISTLGILAIYFTKRIVTKMAILSVTVTMLIYSTSRGGLAVALIAGIAMALIGGLSGWKRVGFAAGIILAVVLSLNFFQRSFAKDLAVLTSTATRSGMMLSAINAVAHNPLGVGYAGFLPAVDRYTPGAIDFLDRWSGENLNFTELESYIKAGTDDKITAKTFLFDNLFYFGVSFLVAFFMFHWKIIRRTTDGWLLYGILFSAMAVSSYIGALGMYNLSLLYGVAYNEIRRAEGLGSRP